MPTQNRNAPFRRGTVMVWHPASVIRWLLIAAYAVLVLGVPVAPLPGWAGAKMTLAGLFLLPALAGGLVWMSLAGPKRGVCVPVVVFGYGGYLAILAWAAGLNPETAYDPLPPLAALLVGICLITVLARVHCDAETVRRTVATLGVLAGLVGILGVAEYFGLILYDRNFSSGQKILGTFGNQNHLGGYLCLSLPFALMNVATVRRKPLRIAAGLAAACCLLSVFMTASRSTLVGAVVAAGAFGLLGAFFVFSPLECFQAMPAGRRRELVALVTAGTAAVAAWLVLDGRLVDRFVHIADPEKFLGIRRHMYRAAADIWCDSPQSILFGHGPGAYYRLSPTFLGPDSFFKSMSHVHNEILENLVEGGLAGLFAYLAVLGLTLRKLFTSMGDRSLAESSRWTAIALASSLIAFQTHGLFSISTRTLVVGHSYHWLVGLAWALATGAGHGNTAIFFGRRAVAVTATMLALLAGSAVHLGLHARSDTLLAAARMAETQGRPARAERIYHDVLAMDADNVRACYFLAHLYLVHQVPEGFARFADLTETIVPQYRTIDYFQALMDLKAGRTGAARDGFRFVENQVLRDDSLTLFWSAWIRWRQADETGALDYLGRYLQARFPDRDMVMLPAGNRIRVIHREKGLPRIRIGKRALDSVVKQMPRGGPPEAAFNAASADLAELFESRDFNIWAVLYRDALGEKKTDVRLARKIQERLQESVGDYRCSGRRSELKNIFSLYERLIESSPPRDAMRLRREMLPYYLKDMRFKHYAHWKKRLAEKKG